MAKGKKIPTIVVTAPSTNKSAKNKRRRQNKQRNRGAIAKIAGSNPRKMRNWPSTKDGATFLRGALDPFSDVTLRSVGVPDVFAGETLKHQNTMELTGIADAAGVLSLIVVPSASTPLLLHTGTLQKVEMPTMDATTFVPNGVTIADLDGAGVTGILAGVPWPSWATYYGSGAIGTGGGAGPYGYQSQRVISMGLEWRYTGTELSDQGVCTAAIMDGYCIDGYQDYTRAGTSPTTVKFTQRADLGNMANISTTQLSNVPQYRQLSMHSAEGAGGMLVLISAEEGYVLKPANDYTGLVAASLHGTAFGTVDTTAYTAGLNNAASPGRATFPILPWQNLRPIGIVFSGLAPNMPIVFKIKQRIEATVAPNSPFAQFTDKSPTEDSNAICMVADIQKTLPVMVPVTMNGFGDWWRKIMGTIGSIGRIAGGMGIPFVSPIAGGVGALADVLGSL